LASSPSHFSTLPAFSSVPLQTKSNNNIMANFADNRIGNNYYLENMWWATLAHLILLTLAFTAAECARTIADSIYLPTGEDESTPTRSDVVLTDYSVIMAKRVKRVAENAVVGFLLLFSATTITALGYGGTLTTAVIAWFFVLMMLGQIITILLVDRPLTVVPFQVITHVLIIVLFALAFRDFERPPSRGGRYNNSF